MLLPRHPRVLVAVCIGYFMAVLDSTVVNVALPDMARGLGTGIAGMQWVVDGYALLFASLLLTAGALGDRLGNKGTFVAGLALFTLASGLCGIAPNLGTLIAFRALQGVGAAVQVPASLALLRHAYHDPSERAQAIGIWAAATGLAVAAGPVVGGILTHAWTWRSVFLVNLPVGVLGIVLTLRHVPSVPSHAHGALDLKAQLLGIVALGGLTFGLIQGGVWGWSSAPVILALLVAVVAGVLFYLGERRAEHPMLPPALFRDATFSAANAVGAILSFGFYGELFLMSLFFQQVQHRSTLATGLALLPQTAVISLMNFLSGQITARRGARLPMALGLGIGGSGLVGLAFVGPHAALVSVVGPMLAMGVGASLAMPAMTHAAIDHTPKERAGIGSAVLNASRQVGGVVGIALLGALISSHARRGATTHFMVGLHEGLALAGVLFLVGSGLSLAFVERRDEERAAGVP
jgi:DHA2 family methylenomycin A resistance protein-like MFS transporter